VLFFAVLLVVYIKSFEEKELEARFGDEYRAYKRNTPFLIPRLRSRKG
jgi:protein-S-isoprenylcysteine O-methyltransferase Ste14